MLVDFDKHRDDGGDINLHSALTEYTTVPYPYGHDAYRMGTDLLSRIVKVRLLPWSLTESVESGHARRKRFLTRWPQE